MFSPKKGKVIWGVGPTFVFPTATNTTYLGQGKLSIGPSVVVLVQPTHFTIGFLTNNYWSVAGHSNHDKPPVNQFLLQWFVNYNMKKGWYLKSAPIVTANWRGSNNGVWTAPFGGGVGRIMKLGFQPVNLLRGVLWQCRASHGNFALDPTVLIYAAVSQAKQRAGEDVAGAKTETDGSATATEIVSASPA